MKNVFLIIVFLFLSLKNQAQNNDKNSIVIDRPNLVVGVVVDQMRFDYLYRFYNKYGKGGFKRLMNEGFNCESAYFNYVPTYTAVGHASIFTGATPSVHGIISNNWYDKTIKESIYCVDDASYKTIGAKKGGEKSPKRLLTTTFSDELKLVLKNKSKIIGLSLKDRGAVLPVGHNANAAYWFRGKKDAKFITSSFYMDKLPSWVEDFNESDLAKKLLKVWKPLYNIDTYTESIADDNCFEGLFKGEKAPVFPHDLPNLMSENGNYNLLKVSPFGNTLLEKFAEAAIIGEDLGNKGHTDFLSISFSSTDYIGHRFGPDSIEIEDTYLRLDQDIERLLNFLDVNVGQGKYTLFLTADHGAAGNPSYLQSQKINADYFNFKKFEIYISGIVNEKYHSENIIEDISNSQIFLNRNNIEKLKLNYLEVANFIKYKALLFNGVYKTVTAETLQTTSFKSTILSAVQSGYNQKISGDVMLVLKPATLYKKMKGTAHGASYSYDTHVPLLFFGKGIPIGISKKKIPIVDIAPTISNMLHIEFPNGNEGKIIEMP